VRTWERGDETIDLAELLDAAAAVTGDVQVFDANDPRFLAPGDMPTRIAEWLTERGLAVPHSRAQFVLSIIRSLAAAFADAVHTASELSGVQVDVIHIVGGGSQNELLCQLIADLSGVPVLAGPVEATAIGNVLIQARALRFVTGSLESMRALVASAFHPRRFEPAAGRP
jgi:rhamnulokinase